MVDFVSHERVGSRPTKWLSTRASDEKSPEPCVPPGNDSTDDDNDDDDAAPVRHFSFTLSIFFISLISITYFGYAFIGLRIFGFKVLAHIFKTLISKNSCHVFFIKILSHKLIYLNKKAVLLQTERF